MMNEYLYMLPFPLAAMFGLLATELPAVPDSIIPVLMQAPLVGLLAWFVLKIRAMEREERRELYQAFMAEQAARDKDARQSAHERDAEMREFLTAMEGRSSVTLGEITKQLGAATGALRRLGIVLLRHDAQVRGINPETLGSTEDLLRLLGKGE